VASCAWRVSREPYCEGVRVSLSSAYLEFYQVWSAIRVQFPGKLRPRAESCTSSVLIKQSNAHVGSTRMKGKGGFKRAG